MLKQLKLNENEAKILKNYVVKQADSYVSKGCIEIVATDEIKIVKGNPNKHTNEHIDEISKNISQFGLMVPILKNKNNELITGEGRYLALKELGCSYIASLTIENLSAEILRAYRIADNQLTRSTEFDYSVLNQEFKFLYDYKILGTDLGFSALQIDKIYNYQIESPKQTPSKEPEEVLELKDADIPERVKAGDLWRAGDSFILCANSLKTDSFKYLMQGELAKLVLTDSPYNVPVSGHICGNGKIKHQEFKMASGEMSDEEFEKNFVTPYMGNCIKYSQNGSLHYHFIDWRGLRIFLNVGYKLYSDLKNICVWAKSNGGGMGSLYRSQHEMVCVFKNGDAPHINNVELGKNGRNRTNVWEYPGIRANTPESLELLRLHPTVKPTALLYDILLDVTNQNDIVLDCFGGSGSTLIAAYRSRRRARIIEISPHYCDVILWRWEKESGKKAKFIKNIQEDQNEQ